MINRPRLLIHSIVFSPDSVSTAYLYNDIALHFSNAGYDVVVLTTTPHYNLVDEEINKQPLVKKAFGIYYESYFYSIKVIHVPLKKYKSTSLRILSFVYWHIVSLFIGLSIRKINYVLSVSPPLSIGLIAGIIAKFKGAKSVYNIQEIYPDLLLTQGNIGSGLIEKALTLLEKSVYNISTALTTIDDSFYSRIHNRIKHPQKLHLIPNFVDTEMYKPHTDPTKILPSPFVKNHDTFIVMYAGNIGHYQDWEPLLEASKALENENIEFWIVGEGTNKDNLIKKVADDGLSNIKVYPYVSRSLMPTLNNVADVHFISINEEIEELGFPSKVYTIMACAKPLIVLSGVHSPLYKFLENKDCAFLITEDKSTNLVKTIKLLMNDKALIREKGDNANKEVKEKYTKQIVTDQYLELIKSL